MKVTDALDNAPKAVAILSFAVLIVTVLHDWGYFWVVGLRFQSVQTPYDHLANSIEWLPYSLAFIGFSILFLFGVTRLNRNDDFPKYPSGYRERNFKKKLKWPMALFLFLNIVLSPVPLLFISAPKAVLAVLVASAAYLAILIWLTLYTTIFQKREAAYFLAMSPAFVVMAFSTGVLEADIALKSTSNIYRLEIKNSAPVTLILLRSLDKGVLVWDRAATRTSLIRWEQIDRISHFASVDSSSKPIICNYVTFLCFADDDPSSP